MKNTEYKYLDLLKRKLDPIQEEVCCRTENTIVAAGAGSGKTQVLATRFAWLVMSKNIPARKILTLTFTKKAAAEMYSRIYSILKFFAENPETPEREKNNAKTAIEEFSEVHIQTLDSYCANIVRQAANRYGIKPDFTPGSSIPDLKLKALQFVLKHRNNPAILHFAGTDNLQDFATDFGTIADKYSSLADSSNFFTSKLIAQKEEIISSWNMQYEELKKLPAEIKEFVTTAKDFEEEYGKDDFFIRLNTFLESGTPEFIKLSSDTFEQPETFKKIKAFENWLSELLAIPRSAKKNDIVRNCKALLKKYEDDVLLHGILGFINEYNWIKQYLELLDLFSEQIRDAKRTSGTLTFNDLTMLTLKILEQQEDIRIQEQNAYDKIMIDEFQDNNSKNRDLLFKLSELPDGTLNKEKLFFVGDEKQSIYKFRGAEVSVFNQLQIDLNTKPLQMIYNYRSTNELLASFNKMFGQAESVDSEQELPAPSVFPPVVQNSFEAAFPPMAQARQVDSSYNEKPLPELTESNINAHVCMFNSSLLDDDKDNEFLSTEDQTAFYIATKIKELYDSENPEKRRYSDFAYLDKSRTNRRYITSWLSRLGIPYNLDQQGNLFTEAPVNDIYNYLRLCVYPSDIKAFASVLRSPFTGLSSASTETILAKLASSSENTSDTDSEYIPEPFPLTDSLGNSITDSLIPSETEKYTTAAKNFTENRKKLLSQSITKTLDFLWFDCAYRYETIQNPTVHLLSEHYDLLFELARTADESNNSLAWFVDQLAIIRDNENKSLASAKEDTDLEMEEYPVEKSDAVQIMTIHKSKGLQFKHVFLCGVTGSPKPASSDKTYYSDEFGLSVRPNTSADYFFEKNRNLENCKNDAEFRRVLYVGVTRAEKDFYIVGSWSKPPKSSTAEPPVMQKLINYYYNEAQIPDPEKTGIIQFTKNAPFDFLSIPCQTKSYAYSLQKMTSRIEVTPEVYQNAGTIEYIWPESNRKTPSSLEKSFTASSQSTGLFGNTGNTVNPGDSSLGDSSLQPEDSDSGQKYDSPEDTLTSQAFTAADFGTLVHAYLEAMSNGITPEEFKPAQKLLKSLSETESKEKCSDCIKLCKVFEESSLGQEFYECKKSGRFYKPEWAFRMFHQNTIFTGSIDLIFENPDKTYTIVDYKSDSEICAEKYTAQQNCYRTAAAKMLNCPENKITCQLFFLKHNQQVTVES